MQMKSRVKYHHTPLQWLPSIKTKGKNQKTTSVDKRVKKRNFVRCWWDCKTVQPL